MRWDTHALCDTCWTKIHGPDQPAARVRYPGRDTCCSCGAGTVSGIFVRHPAAHPADTGAPIDWADPEVAAALAAEEDAEL